MKIVAENASKRFNRLSIFKKLNFSISGSGIYTISGRNGSGKSTFLKCLLGLIPLSKGKIKLEARQLAFVAPYYQLFNELTAFQNIRLISKTLNQEDCSILMKEYQLEGKLSLPLKNFSSGMLQRFRFLIAFLREPDLLVLDEPTANLDSEGKFFVKRKIQERSKKTLIVIASNEKEELEWGENLLELS